jgi:hypothetical protein
VKDSISSDILRFDAHDDKEITTIKKRTRALVKLQTVWSFLLMLETFLNQTHLLYNSDISPAERA